MTILSRRAFTAGTALAATSLAAGPALAAEKVLRVGYQKFGNLLLLKATGILEAKVKPFGYDVEWKQFLSGPPLLEALGAGALDVGLTGETPPVFAQAAGIPVVYLAHEPPAPKSEAILVAKNSPIQKLADLKGKRVAVAKGSNAHFLLVKALEAGGLTPNDITPVYLQPPDGRAAFERGAVDAWSIWDPYFASAEATLPSRVLTDATGLVPNHIFYLGSRRFTDQKILAAFIAAITEIDQQTTANPAAGAKILGPETGIPEPILVTALNHQAWSIQPIDAKIVAAQQDIADRFFALGLIPKAIQVKDALPDSPT